MINSPLCSCGSNLPYANCCLPILEGYHCAPTAEALMRSRYTAFVCRHEEHILASWHKKYRPEKLNFEGHPVVWLGLTIHEVREGLHDDQTGTVDFTSTYLENGQISRLRENSQFVREDGRWYYLKGDCQVTRQKVERNGPCPCGSGKKFKRCCLLATFSK
jgi:SEC-C motif-containing protein